MAPLPPPTVGRLGFEPPTKNVVSAAVPFDRRLCDSDKLPHCLEPSERKLLLDPAQVRASYTPLFWGHSRSIPQGMILDVQPLVQSLFCPIRPSPNGFFILRPLSPKTGYHFFEGGVGGVGGGVKGFRSEASKQWGSRSLSDNRPSNGDAADTTFLVGGSNPGRPTVGGGGGGAVLA